MLQLNTLISKVIHKQNATLHNLWVHYSESKEPALSLHPCVVWACVQRHENTLGMFAP